MIAGEALSIEHNSLETGSFTCFLGQSWQFQSSETVELPALTLDKFCQFTSIYDEETQELFTILSSSSEENLIRILWSWSQWSDVTAWETHKTAKVKFQMIKISRCFESSQVWNLFQWVIMKLKTKYISIILKPCFLYHWSDKIY